MRNIKNSSELDIRILDVYEDLKNEWEFEKLSEKDKEELADIDAKIFSPIGK